MSIIIKFINSFSPIILLSLLLGMLWSQQFIFLAPYSTIFLGLIFFLSALKIDLRQIMKRLKDKKTIIVVSLYMLIGLPILIYYLTNLLLPQFAIAFLLLAAMPVGVATPLLAEVAGGRQDMALVLVVITSLFAPLTIPLVLQLVVGVFVEVSFWTMFWSLFRIIFIPFLLAQVVIYFWQPIINKAYSSLKPFSIISLGLLIVGIVARRADVLRQGLIDGGLLIYLLYLFIFFIVLHFFAYLIFFWKKKEDWITLITCLTYMNFVLAVYLADKFFEDPLILTVAILSVLPWALLLVPFKFVTKSNRMNRDLKEIART